MPPTLKLRYIFGGVIPRKIINHEKPRIFFKATKLGSLT